MASLPTSSRMSRRTLPASAPVDVSSRGSGVEPVGGWDGAEVAGPWGVSAAGVHASQRRVSRGNILRRVSPIRRERSSPLVPFHGHDSLSGVDGCSLVAAGGQRRRRRGRLGWRREAWCRRGVLQIPWAGACGEGRDSPALPCGGPLAPEAQSGDHGTGPTAATPLMARRRYIQPHEASRSLAGLLVPLLRGRG